MFSFILADSVKTLLNMMSAESETINVILNIIFDYLNYQILNKKGETAINVKYQAMFTSN